MRISQIPVDQAHWHELRSKNINSTEVAALFGLSPYLTEFELWHRKKEGVIESGELAGRPLWGTRLQDAIAKGLAEDHEWMIRRMNEYIYDPELRMGSSFDFEIFDARDGFQGLLEIKNVDSLAFKNGWIADDRGIEAPSYIEIQLQHQLEVSKKSYGYIGALVGGNQPATILRKRNDDVVYKITEKVAAFWKSIDENNPPSPDFSRDSQFIAKLYGYAEAGAVLDATNSEQVTMLASMYRQISESIKDLEAKKAEAKAEMLALIGDASKTIGNGFTISSGMVKESVVQEHVRAARRDFRINWRSK